MRNGKYLFCRQCNADDHFIRDCPDSNRSALFYFAASTTDEDVFDLSMNETLDLFQELPDPELQVLWAAVTDEEPKDKPPEPENSPDEVFFTPSADYSELHRLASSDRTLAHPYVYDTSGPCLFTKNSMRELNAVLRNRMREMTDMEFEGIALDIGASKTPGGLSEYLRYCRHTGTTTHLATSSSYFSGIENGIVPSLGLARLRLPLDQHLFIDFVVDIIEKEIPLLFGLEKHPRPGY